MMAAPRLRRVVVAALMTAWFASGSQGRCSEKEKHAVTDAPMDRDEAAELLRDLILFGNDGRADEAWLREKYATPRRFAAIEAFPEITSFGVLYADVDTIGNNGPTAAEFAGNIAAARRLGGAKGLGFGWDNLSVYKIGAIYKPNERLTWRAGWNHCEKLVPDSQALLAPLVPAPMQNDMTAGLSYRLAGGHEISIAYMHSFWSKTENKKSQFFGAPVKAEGGVDAFNVGYARNF